MPNNSSIDKDILDAFELLAAEPSKKAKIASEPTPTTESQGCEPKKKTPYLSLAFFQEQAPTTQHTKEQTLGDFAPSV